MARLGKTPIQQRRQRPLNRPGAESLELEHRISPIKDLIRKRRRFALAYRRSQSDIGRRRLAEIDHELASYNIDIPAVLQRVAQRKA